MSSCISAIFNRTDRPASETAQRLIDLFEKELSGYLKSYFASIRFEAAAGSFRFFNETMTLDGKEALLSRLRLEHGGQFAYELNLGFAPSVAYVALLAEPGNDREMTVHVTFEKEFTSYVLSSEVAEVPFILILERIARSISSDGFVAGFYEDHLVQLPSGWLTKPDTLIQPPLILCWNDRISDGQAVIQALGAKPEWLQSTLNGFFFVSLSGRYDELRKPD
jgi:hypothetical protein